MIVVIEPHFDDALLSMGAFLLKCKEPIKIISIFQRKEDVNETKLIKEFEFKHIILGGYKDMQYRLFKKRYKFRDVKNKMDFLYEKLEKDLSNNINLDKDIVFKPLGIGHPVHLLISDMEFSREKNTFYYRDFPHSYKFVKNGFLMSRIKGLFPKFKLDFVVKDKELIKKKFELFKKYYKSQKALLFFDKRFFDMLPNEEFYKRI